MNSSLIVLCVLTCICFVLQLLPILSVPLTGSGVNYNLYLSAYNDLKFGVFGICNITSNECTGASIGYPATFNSLVANATSNPDSGFTQLPSRTRYTVSKLLIVHVLGFCCSAVLFIILGSLVARSLYNERQKRKIHLSNLHLSPQRLSALRKLVPRARPPKDYEGEITPYLTLSLMLSLLSFLLTLLALLVDILLFVPHLGYVGWIQMCPLIITMLISCMLCFMKRSIDSHRLYQLPQTYEFDDLRTKRSGGDSDRESLSSDDGFFVYTNGFYSQKPDEAQSESDLHETRWHWRNRVGGDPSATSPSTENEETIHR